MHMVRCTPDAVARAFVAICVLLLFGYLHLTSVYYPVLGILGYRRAHITWLLLTGSVA